jgi:hypothetical protein
MEYPPIRSADNEARTILIVEDERIVARDLRMTLEEMGYVVSATVRSSTEPVAPTGAVEAPGGPVSTGLLIPSPAATR